MRLTISQYWLDKLYLNPDVKTKGNPLLTKLIVARQMQHMQLTSRKLLCMNCMIITAITDIATFDSGLFIWVSLEGAS